MRNKLCLLIILLISIHRFVYPQSSMSINDLKIEIAKSDQFFTKSRTGEYILIEKRTENEKLQLILKNILNNTEAIISPFDEETLFDALIMSDENILLLSAGSNWAMSNKYLLAYNLKSRQFIWNLPITNDFFVDLEARDKKIVTGGRNTGYIFKLDVEGKVDFSKKGFAQHTYYVGFGNSDNIIIGNGADSYKEKKYKIRIWNEKGDILKEFDGFSDSYKFSTNPNREMFLSYSTNQYLDQNEYIEVWDFDGKKLFKIKPENSVVQVSFSLDGNYIIAAGGYNENCKIEIFDIQGKRIKNIPVKTTDEFIQIQKFIIHDNNTITVILCRSEL